MDLHYHIKQFLPLETAIYSKSFSSMGRGSIAVQVPCLFFALWSLPWARPTLLHQLLPLLAPSSSPAAAAYGLRFVVSPEQLGLAPPSRLPPETRREAFSWTKPLGL
jgi:hypothetical protein